MKRGISSIVSACLLGVAMTAQAAVSATDIAMLEADIWRARMGFHLLSIRGDNPDDRAALQRLLSSGEAQVNHLIDQAGSGEQAQWQAIADAWQALSARAVDNPLASQGYADYGAMSEMNSLTLDLAGQLEQLQPQQDKSPYLDILDLSVAMQRLASEYLALAAFPSAGLPTGTSEEPLNFAIEAKAIDDQLAALQKRYAEDLSASLVVTYASQRWAFIRNSIPRMDDPQYKKVPYLFYRYSSEVAERVSALVAG